MEEVEGGKGGKSVVGKHALKPAWNGRFRPPCPPAQYLRGFPACLPANARLTRVSALLRLKRPKDVDFRPVVRPVTTSIQRAAASHHTHSTPLAHFLQRLPRVAYCSIVTPPARVKRASPNRQAGNPCRIMASGMPARKCPIDAGFSVAPLETPIRRGLLAGRYGQLLRAFNPPRTQRT